LPSILHRHEAPLTSPPTISFPNLRFLGFPKAAVGNPKNPKRALSLSLVLYPSWDAYHFIY
jgi:hypothetical protein